MKKLVWLTLMCTIMVVSVTAQPSGIPYLTAESISKPDAPTIENVNLLKPNALVKSELSTLWTALTLNMITADVLSSYIPEGMEEYYEFADGNEADLMTGAAVMYQIPISMVILSKMLPYKANRKANMIAAGLMTAAVVGGGSTDPHYLIIGGVEVLTMSYIFWKAMKWQDSDAAPTSMSKHDLGMNLNLNQQSYGLKYTYKF